MYKRKNETDCNNYNYNSSNVRNQLFTLNTLSTEELRLKWSELYKVNPANFKRDYLIKGLAYKIQSLYGMSNISENEVELAIKVTKKKLTHTTNTNPVAIQNINSSSSDYQSCTN